jgi:AcrR family transcriptional regulator
MIQTSGCNREESMDTSIFKGSVTEPEGLTKGRLLDVAERLFADHGIDGTSLRQITKEAGVNLGAVNYHFRSKEELMVTVFNRRFGPLKQEQLNLLKQAQQQAGDVASIV